jgi:hypothetical protein
MPGMRPKNEETPSGGGAATVLVSSHCMKVDHAILGMCRVSVITEGSK